jgi:hypothetical protein
MLEALKPDQSVAVVNRSETGKGLALVLRDSFEEVIRDPYVNGSAFARNDVSEVVVVTHGWKDIVGAVRCV